MDFRHTWVVDRFNARVNITLCGRKCVNWRPILGPLWENTVRQIQILFLRLSTRPHVRLGIITTFEIIILYLISDVYHVHTAAETSPSPAHTTVQHDQSAKCWKFESMYITVVIIANSWFSRSLSYCRFYNLQNYRFFFSYERSKI